MPVSMSVNRVKRTHSEVKNRMAEKEKPCKDCGVRKPIKEGHFPWCGAKRKAGKK